MGEHQRPNTAGEMSQQNKGHCGAAILAWSFFVGSPRKPSAGALEGARDATVHQSIAAKIATGFELDNQWTKKSYNSPERTTEPNSVGRLDRCDELLVIRVGATRFEPATSRTRVRCEAVGREHGRKIAADQKESPPRALRSGVGAAVDRQVRTVDVGRLRTGDERYHAATSSACPYRASGTTAFWPNGGQISLNAAPPCSHLNDCHPRPVNAYFRATRFVLQEMDRVHAERPAPCRRCRGGKTSPEMNAGHRLVGVALGVRQGVAQGRHAQHPAAVGDDQAVLQLACRRGRPSRPAASPPRPGRVMTLPFA